jgi:hypothetical protein
VFQEILTFTGYMFREIVISQRPRRAVNIIQKRKACHSVFVLSLFWRHAEVLLLVVINRTARWQ